MTQVRAVCYFRAISRDLKNKYTRVMMAEAHTKIFCKTFSIWQMEPYQRQSIIFVVIEILIIFFFASAEVIRIFYTYNGCIGAL